MSHRALGPQWSTEEIESRAQVFSRNPDDPNPLSHDPQYDWHGLAAAVKRGDVAPTVKVRATRLQGWSEDKPTAFQVDDGTHRFYAAKAGLIPNRLNVEFVSDVYQSPASGGLLKLAERDWKR